MRTLLGALESRYGKYKVHSSVAQSVSSQAGSPAKRVNPKPWLPYLIGNKNLARGGGGEYSVGRSIATYNAPCFSVAGLIPEIRRPMHGLTRPLAMTTPEHFKQVRTFSRISDSVRAVPADYQRP